MIRGSVFQWMPESNESIVQWARITLNLIQLFCLQGNKHKTALKHIGTHKTDSLYLTWLRFLKVHLSRWNTCLIFTKWTNFILKRFLCRFRNNNACSRPCRGSPTVWHTHNSRWTKPNPFKVINESSSTLNQWVHKVSALSESRQHKQNVTIYQYIAKHVDPSAGIVCIQQQCMNVR